MKEGFDAQWHELAEEVLAGMKEWRLQQSRATFCEIEQALDERLGKVRARLLQDLALASAAADLRTAQEQERPACPRCGAKLESEGQKARHLVTYHDQELTLERSYGVCPNCGEGFFPPRC